MGQDCNRIADLPLQPQSGSILQPKVAVAATLGPGGDDFPNPERVVPGLRRVKNETHELSIPAQPRCGWLIQFHSVPNVAATVTLGWRTQPRCGWSGLVKSDLPTFNRRTASPPWKPN